MNHTVLSLFSGCGGLDLGIEGGFFVHKECIHSSGKKEWLLLPKNKFEVIFATDIMPQAHAVWSSNFKGEFQQKSIVDLVAEKYPFPKTNLIIGGFPCQDFSVAGKREGFTGKKGYLYHSMVDVISYVSPEAFIAENVYGLLYIPGAKEQIISDFESVGYQVFSYLLCAHEYGVPQTRKRIFFIGLKKDALKHTVSIDDVKPVKTHEHPVSLDIIFHDLLEPEESQDKEQQQYSKSKFYGFRWEGNREVNLLKPSPTLRASGAEFRRLSIVHGGKHVEELYEGKKERRLTVRECARIQTFPDNFNLMFNKKGESIVSMSAAYRLLGNAVPPLLAYHVAKKLNDVWLDIFK